MGEKEQELWLKYHQARRKYQKATGIHPIGMGDVLRILLLHMPEEFEAACDEIRNGSDVVHKNVFDNPTN